MKFTSEDLMKWLGLQVGDRIRINDKPDNYIVELNECGIPCVKDKHLGIRFEMTYLINRKVELLPRPKRVGDLKCEELGCMTCPLRILSHCGKSKGQEDNLYKILNYWNNEYPNFDQEIHDLLKTRLDKEVVEE